MNGNQTVSLVSRELTNKDVIEKVFWQYQAGLRHRSYKILGNWDEVDDVLSKAILRGLKEISTTNQEQIKAWLFTTVRNASIDITRKRKRISAELPLLEECLPSVELDMLADQDAIEVRKAVAQLRAMYSQAITLYYFDDLSYKEAGEVCGITAQAFCSRLVRARDSLRDLLQPFIQQLATS